jgi:hypothetical protein
LFPDYKRIFWLFLQEISNPFASIGAHSLTRGKSRQQKQETLSGAQGHFVPEISRFLGIVIAMYYNDHLPPHFHARYGEYEIRVNIETGGIMSGSFPPRARKHVLEWLDLHRPELVEDWRRAEKRKPLRKIEPLE